MSSPQRTFSFFSWILWSLATWIFLAGAVFGLMGDLEKSPWHWGLVLTMPPMAVLCGWRALRAGATLGRWARVVFWMGASAGIALAALLFQGQCEVLNKPYHRHLLTVAAILPVLVLVLLGVRKMRSGGLKEIGFGWILEILGGTACFVLVVATAYFVWLKAYVEPLRRKAEQRWVEIGHPMPEFEKSLKRVEENESLRELTRDLKPFGVVTFYKTASGGGRITTSNTIEVPMEIIDSLYATKPGDSIKLSPKASATLDARANALDNVYRGILQREPAVWEMNPRDGFSTLVPNFLAVRKLSQWIVVDAFHRLERGDEKGAAMAVDAGMRMTQNLGEQPILVSNMIRVAIQALFTNVIARLPEDPSAEEPAAMQRLADDVEMERRQFVKTVQFEAWETMHAIETENAMGAFIGDGRWDLPVIQPLPNRVGKRLWRLVRLVNGLYCGHAWLYQADTVQICERKDIVASDLGAQEIEKSERLHPAAFAINWSRAWLRTNLMLLLREQAELIRAARAQMQAGKSGNLGERQSVVIPGSKWEMSGDAAAHSITLKLTPRPKWTADNTVVTDGFFLLPLDGSKSWRLRTAAN